MEVYGRVEPEIELLLSVAFALREDVSVKNIRIPTYISQELKVNLVMIWSLRRQLPIYTPINHLINEHIEGNEEECYIYEDCIRIKW